MEPLKACRFFSSLRLCVLVAVTVTTVTGAAAQNTSSIRLLPTGREAARLRVLEDTLEHHRPDDVQALYAELKAIVQDFVARQLDAFPGISDRAMHDQLRRVIGRILNDDGEEALYVRSAPNSWEPGSNQRVWVVAYALPDGVGSSGVIDCYVREKGRTRLAGRQEADFLLYSLQVDWLAGGPYQVALLANGRLAGSNGLGGWKAAVYFCDPRGVHTVWQSPALHGLTAVARGQLIALRHAQPAEGAASSAASWTYEVYVFDPWPFERPTVTLVSRETRDR